MIHVWPDAGSMVMQAFGWSLLHFLWQGSVLALALAVFLRLAHAASAKTRYAVSGLILIAMMLCLAVTTVFSRFAVMPHFAVVHAGVVTVTVLPLPGRAWMLWQSIKMGSLVLAARSLPVCVWIWAAGSLLLLARLALAVASVSRLRRRAFLTTPACLALERAARIERIAPDVSLQVLCSREISAPAVIGWIRPVLLLPEGCALSSEEFEAVLAHEMAHVRRRDYAVHLLQSVGEALLFFHPAMWWVSRRIAEEREHCCDDAAVAACGSPLIYAKALSRLEEGRRTFKSGFQLSANGGTLSMRIERILARRKQQSQSNRRIAFSGMVIASLTLCGLFFGSQIAVRQTSAYAAEFNMRAAADGMASADFAPPVPKKEPNLACAYYDTKEHDGICDVNHFTKDDYYCIRADDKSQSQLQVACGPHVQAWLAWKKAQKHVH